MQAFAPSHMTVDDERRWWSAGAELVAFRGCDDVDLGITPVTNTLPIRRLHLAIGETRAVTAAWLQFPDSERSRLLNTTRGSMRDAIGTRAGRCVYDRDRGG